ncbi:hypothetical protein DdX_04699 [Ditylenchus destructor]|uniref:Uncharacterized protein n=1 Tax=Ditylenchus destructor TaxID=166010 RepID=A0AAD4N7Z9_9BILA|nr:hypothetical protein DdX_04699 [Ditylenchus destructor]
MASGNPGFSGCRAPQNFSHPTRIRASDTSIASSRRDKQNEVLLSRIRVGRGKIWLPEILDFREVAHLRTFHAPLGSGRVIRQSLPLDETSKMSYYSAGSEWGVGRYGLRKSWIFGLGGARSAADAR